MELNPGCLIIFHRFNTFSVNIGFDFVRKAFSQWKRLAILMGWNFSSIRSLKHENPPSYSAHRLITILFRPNDLEH